MESRILQFISALRAGGVRISLAESAEAFSAVDLMGTEDRQHFRLSLRATLIKDSQNLSVFDRLFPLFFGAGQPPLLAGSLQDQLTPQEAQMLAPALREIADKLRSRTQRLINGEPLSQEELDGLARLAGFDALRDLRHQDWMAQRMLRALVYPAVLEALQDVMLQLAQPGMDRERVEQLRELIQKNLQSLGEQIHQFAGERLAENLSRQSPADTQDSLLDRPFDALSDEDKKAIQRAVRRLAAALRTRVALRQKRAKSGHLDPKATLRFNLKYQGIPMEIRHRDRVRKPKLVVLCDVSTSMRFCAELMLGFLFALQGQIRKTHAFAFVDHLESISEHYDGTNADEAIASVLWRMPGGHYNTDLGWSLNDFNIDYMDTLNGQTTLIILGDGRNNYNNPRLDLFARMSRRATRTIWLNPEPAQLWQGDSDMPKYAPFCHDVLKVGNLRDLASAVDQLLSA